jgi:hypothetical protein
MISPGNEQETIYCIERSGVKKKLVRDQHGLGHTLRTVASDLAGDLAAARRVTDVDGEMLDQLGKAVGVPVHVVAGPWLARAPVAAAVVVIQRNPREAR